MLLLAGPANWEGSPSILSRLQLDRSNSKLTKLSQYKNKQQMETASIVSRNNSPCLSLCLSEHNLLSDTHETAQIAPSPSASCAVCPSCQSRTQAINYYACCISPMCSNCYSGFHFLECNKSTRTTLAPAVKTGLSLQQIKCERCQSAIIDQGYSCKQCITNSFCEDCFHIVHGGKFKVHAFKKWSRPQKCKQRNILLCEEHKKLRCVVTQNSELLCPDCSNALRPKKPKFLDFISPCSLSLSKSQVMSLASEFVVKYESHKSKWIAISKQLESQYSRISTLVVERYESNLNLLKSMEQYDLKVLEKAIKESTTIREEIVDHWDRIQEKQLLITRGAIMENQLLKLRAEVKNNELFVHKVGTVDIHKIESLLKGFTINKLKLRDLDQNKQNLTSKKLNSSVMKPNALNLSVSRRSLSKSVSKVEPKGSGLKQSAISNHRSQNLSHQVASTQPIRSSTPPHGNQQLISASSGDKKSTMLRQSSILSAKIEDITPVILNFDQKDTNGSRINFLSSKTELDNCLSEQAVSSQNQSRVSKKKADYFQLRDRMRKPSIGQNRFSKR